MGKDDDVDDEDATYGGVIYTRIRKPHEDWIQYSRVFSRSLSGDLTVYPISPQLSGLQLKALYND